MILFLDFDGVLHPYFQSTDSSDPESQNFCFLGNFENALRNTPQLEEIDIVISSRWRLNRSLEDLQSLFSPDIAKKIIGKTPFLDDNDSEDGARQKEVEAWLITENKTDQSWIGIDDNVYLYDRPACVVFCMDGFREREMLLLKEALQDPILYAQKYPLPRGQENRVKPRVRIGGAP